MTSTTTTTTATTWEQALVPFVFGHKPWLPLCVARLADAGFHAVAQDVLDDDNAGFFRLLLAGNARAFGGMGMPAWVQLDCATLPTTMVGFALPRRVAVACLGGAVVDDLCRAAAVDVDGDHVDDDALIPVAEYCALPTPEPGHVVGFSLFALVPGLGVRAKALGLLAYGARVQTGVTQIDNTALKTHTRFGPLVVEKRGVLVHSKPGTTLVYRLTVPAPSTLTALARGSITRVAFGGAVDEKAALVDGDVVVDVVAGRFVCARPALTPR